MSKSSFEIRPVTGALGAEVSGIDLSREMSPQLFAELHEVWLDHQVLFFRDQELTNEQFEAFVSRFGDIEIHSFMLKVDGSETVERLTNKDSQWTPSTSNYHIDVSMRSVPTKGAALYAIDVEAAGGDTIWVNTYAAFEGLSEPMQTFIETCNGLFVAMHRRALDGIIRGGPDAVDMAAGFLQQAEEHPLVHTHPETGKKALFVDGLFMWEIVGLHSNESDALKNFLLQHVAMPEYQCRFHWQPGSVAIWDNRCTMHRRVDDAFGGRRIMHRIPIKGETEPQL
jgi:taurine dioxygenase